MARKGSPALLLAISVTCIAILFCVAFPLGLHDKRDHHLQHYSPQWSLETKTFHFAIVSDNDAKSRASRGVNEWQSKFKLGTLIRTSVESKWRVEWGPEMVLTSKLAEDGRGLELSELAYFHGKLFTCSDRTGVVYQIVHNTSTSVAKLVPLVILNDGDGSQQEAFKCEWMTVRDEELFVGSTGKLWVDAEKNVVANHNRQWIKTIDRNGKVSNVPWMHVYQKVQKETKCEDGFIVHEAVSFNHFDRRWYFLPRKMSKKPWSPEHEELIGANLLISCDEKFEDFRFVRVAMEKGHEGHEHGFSAFRFIPFRTEMAALRTMEVGNSVHTDLVVIDSITGKVLLHEECGLGDKYEGLEFLH